MVWNYAWNSTWLPCFQKSICRDRSSRRARRPWRKRGILCSTFQTPGCRFLCLSPLVLRINAGGRDQSDQPARPGRETAPKIVDHCSLASTQAGHGGFVSELGLDLSMGPVLHCSSRRNTSQPLSDSMSVLLSACDVQLRRHRR